MLKMNISETVFFPSTVIEWNKLANNIQVRDQLVLLKHMFLNVSEQVLIVCLMCIILMEVNYLQDYDLDFCVSANLETIFRIPQTHFGTAVGILKELFTSFSTAQFTQTKEKLFSIKLVTLNQKIIKLNQIESIIKQLYPL